MNVGRLEPCIQLPLSEKELKECVDKAKDWALMHGNCLFTDKRCVIPDNQVIFI